MDLQQQLCAVSTAEPHQEHSWQGIIAAANFIQEERQKMINEAQNTFKELFGADFTRGDVVIFPKSQEQIYHQFNKNLPDEVMQKIRLDHYGLLDSVAVIKGAAIKGAQVAKGYLSCDFASGNSRSVMARFENNNI